MRSPPSFTRPSRGTTVRVLLVEQSVRHALALAHRACVLENGRLVLAGPAKHLLADDRLKRAYLGMEPRARFRGPSRPRPLPPGPPAAHKKLPRGLSPR
jgi:hypothetical protein